MKAFIVLASLVSATAFAGSRSELEQPAQSPGYLHAASTKVSKNADKDLVVKHGAGVVVTNAPAAKSDLVDRKSKQ